MLNPANKWNEMKYPNRARIPFLQCQFDFKILFRLWFLNPWTAHYFLMEIGIRDNIFYVIVYCPRSSVLHCSQLPFYRMITHAGWCLDPWRHGFLRSRLPPCRFRRDSGRKCWSSKTGIPPGPGIAARTQAEYWGMIYSALDVNVHKSSQGYCQV